MKPFAVALSLSVAFAWAQVIEFTTDHTNALYRCGEKAVFTLKVLGDDKQLASTGRLNVRLDNFGPTVFTNASFDLSAGNPVTLSATLSDPGFLRCSASVKIEKSTNMMYGVAYEPERLKPGSVRPADFDAFWDGAIRKLDAQVPMDERIERIDAKSDSNHECFRVSFATFDGLRVWGFLAIPKKGEGPFPVQVNVPGAGPGVVGPSYGLADKGVISMVMNVHPFEPCPDAASQQKRYAEQDAAVKAQYGVQRYCHAGATNRETYFYYRIALGINRAVNWLASRPDADKTRFYYAGTSQGGGFGYILCGLNKNFTKGVMHVAAICDLMGFQAGRESGWPKLIESLPAEQKEAAGKVAPYFDGAHFAPRISIPIRASVGFIDTTCPPAAVYSAFNALASKDKAMGHGLAMPHAVFPVFSDQFDAKWMRGQ